MELASKQRFKYVVEVLYKWRKESDYYYYPNIFSATEKIVELKVSPMKDYIDVVFLSTIEENIVDDFSMEGEPND